MKGRKQMKKFKKEIGFINAMVMMLILNVTNVYAAGDETTITQPIANLKNLLISIVAVVGVVFLVKGIYEFAVAYSQNDMPGTSMAIKQIISGLLMTGVSTVLAIMGIG